MVNTNKLKGRIVELGFTQTDAAECLGIAQSTFNQKINNVRPMDLNEADKLAEWLKIPDTEYGTYFFYHPVA